MVTPVDHPGVGAERPRCLADQAPNTPVAAGPVFGFTGELNPAARVTAEAEMEDPSPPFSSSRQGLPVLTKSRKKTVLQRRYGEIQHTERECLELIPGRTGVVTEVVTGLRKGEIRS